MPDKLQALVAIITLVPVLKFRLSETKRPVALHLTSRFNVTTIFVVTLEWRTYLANSSNLK
ncbi:hypothetical protein KY285_029882 [Solanum tuberosum]|nr:hypothetical protein KY285_029882 [Solanum tuberosum]